jgi:hypothetical protein
VHPLAIIIYYLEASLEGRREAKYSVGESFLKARKEFFSNNEYSDWVAELLKNSATKPHRNELSNYRKFAEFYLRISMLLCRNNLHIRKFKFIDFL